MLNTLLFALVMASAPFENTKNNFMLAGANVLADGLTVVLEFQAGVSVGQNPVNRLRDTGMADYLPGVDAGYFVQVNGKPAEIVGIEASDWTMPLSWINAPINGKSGLPAGNYYFLVTVVDREGREKYVSPPIMSYMNTNGEVATSIAQGQSVVVNWRAPCSLNGTVNIYACTQLPLFGNLKRVASVPYKDLRTPTSYNLSEFTGDKAPFNPSSTSWKVTCLLSSPIRMGADVVVNAPANLIVDEKNNSTMAIKNTSAVNRSIVGEDGFLATPENETATVGKLSFTKSIYISFSQGEDADGCGTFQRPYKTVNYAMSQVSSNYRNIRFRLLRGDTWPAEVWTRAYWGTGFQSPTLFESYWKDSYGKDPGKRPIITVGDPYFDMKSKNLDATATLFQNSEDTQNLTSRFGGEHPYIYYRGLAFHSDINYASTGAYWPANSPEDHVVISDCEFQNVVLVGSYGNASWNAPVGCMIHRSIIHSTHGSPNNTGCERGSGNTTLILPDLFVNPWPGPTPTANLVAPGQDYFRLSPSGNRWNLANWSVTISEGKKSETRKITKHQGGSANYWFVDSPFQGTYTRKGCKISLDPTGQQFKIRAGAGSGGTVYTVDQFDAATRKATVSPAMPAVDETTRIAFLPLERWDFGGHIQGIYLAHCGDWLYSQNVFDKCGWNWDDDTADYNDIYNHNVYLSSMSRSVIFHSNYVLRSNSVGLQLRGGGVIAYNVFAENVHGNNLGDAGSIYKNLYVDQGWYNISAWAFASYLPGMNVDFNIILKTKGHLENRVPGMQGLVAINCDNNGGASPSYLAIRHNTLVDSGMIDAGMRLPIPGKLHVKRNLFANRPKSSLDVKGLAVQTSALQLKPDWNKNGLFSDATGKFMAHVDWDQNAYLIPAHRAAFSWPDYTGNDFKKWRASGRDKQGLLLSADPDFATGDYAISTYAAQLKAGTSSQDLWMKLRNRQEGVWGELFSGKNCYNQFAAAYQPDPKRVPVIDKTPTGFYGATPSLP